MHLPASLAAGREEQDAGGQSGPKAFLAETGTGCKFLNRIQCLAHNPSFSAGIILSYQKMDRLYVFLLEWTTQSAFQLKKTLNIRLPLVIAL